MKKQNKSNNKSKDLKNKIDPEILNLLKIVFNVFIVVVVVFGLTMFFEYSGVFDEGYTPIDY